MPSVIKKHIFFCALITAVWEFYIKSGINCPFAHFFNIICPTCGVTRALTALLHGDLALYIHYQPLAVFLVIAVILAIHLSKFKYKKAAALYIAAVLIANTALYITRLQNLYF